MTSPQNSHRFIPIIISLGMVIGIGLGSFYANHFSGHRLDVVNSSSNKINDLLHLIDDQYVDTVNIEDLVEKSLPKILGELDPHSTYTAAADVEQEMQNLQGHFSGIGIQFYIYRDTVNVVKVIPGGPSDGTRIQAGDRIIAVDGRSFTGKHLTSDQAVKTLKGEKGSTIQLTLMRPGVQKQKLQKPQTFQVTVTRGDVPLRSIETAYMLDNQTGYIRIKSFGSTTYSEFISALAQLGSEGMEKIILDLRDNLGGYMDTAVQIANEFLPKGRLIVYTQGRRSPRQDFHSDGRGSYQDMPLVVLINEYSASASEILAGAMQDNKRATIIGRRSFGKGLVQAPIEFRDGSMLRLTRARYYTPSGRCVQKPYQLGDPEEKYQQDIINRELSGELFSADSIKNNGGIIPDTFVPLDTAGYTSYFKEASMRGLLQEFSYYYVDTHRQKLLAQPHLAQYLARQNLPEEFAAYAERRGLKRRNNLLRISSTVIRTMLTSYILGDIQDTSASQRYYNAQDPIIAIARRKLGN